MASSSVRIVSVNVGRPAHLGTHQGSPVQSAIAKQPVPLPSLALTAENLAGDRQADLRVHGGPDKAVFAYPSEHLAAWARELGPGGFAPGAIGENLTTAGWTEPDVCIGDTWRWGDALLQVSQPRSPCFKLGLATGRPEIVRLFEELGRSGWYLRVLQPGEVPTAGSIAVETLDPRRLSVSRAQRLRQRGGGEADEIAAAAAHPALAASWRAGLLHRLELVGGRAS